MAEGHFRVIVCVWTDVVFDGQLFVAVAKNGRNRRAMAN